MTKLEIGDSIYVMDRFDRRERKNVYRKLTITAETGKEYILGGNGTINKRSGRARLSMYRKGDPTHPFYTGQEVWQQEWVSKNDWKLSDAIKRVRDFEKLEKIAKIAGYDPQIPEYIIK